jgi:tetratricopeptide (TPR) repeat protein
MRKLPLFLALGLLAGILPTPAVAQLARSQPAVRLGVPSQTLNAFPAAAAQGSVWKSQDEYNAYTAMHNEKDVQKKIALAEAFLTKYPDSAVKNYVYAEMLDAYNAANDYAKVSETAKKLIESDPNNLAALRYLSFLFPFTFKPDSPDATAAMSRAESDAKHGLDLLAKAPKPANMSDDQFQQALKPLRAIFNGAIAFVALQQKDYPAAITSYKASLEDNPNDMYGNYRLGIAYLMSSPADYNNGFWYLARALSLARASKAPDAAGIEKYLDQAYTNYHGNKEGLEDIITQTASSPNPPDGFQVAALKPPEKTGNPNIDSFNQLAFPLKLGGTRAQQTWSQLKGQPLGLGGFVNSVEKGEDPKTFSVKISLDQAKAETDYDIILVDSTQPKVADLSVGDPVRFQGTIDSYTASPSFSLTLVDGKINDDDIAAAAAKPKRKPARRR